MDSVMKFVLSGSAGSLATCVVQPLDLVKTRMQVTGAGGVPREYKNSLHCIRTVVLKEGPLALYNGIGAALLRQATYTTTRLGTYDHLEEQYSRRMNAEPDVIFRLLAGMTSGACGAFVGTPAEVVLIRMTSDGRLPPDQRLNYKNVIHALTTISRTEGVLALWRGTVPTMGRAMVVNMAQLATYSQAKSYLKNDLLMKDNIGSHLLASMISGLATTIASLPVDMAKTRIQNMKIIDGVPEYKGAIDVITSVIRKEGVFALWKGFSPYLFRIGPHTVLTFVILEQLKSFYNSYKVATK